MEKGSWVGVQIILPGAVAALPVQIGSFAVCGLHRPVEHHGDNVGTWERFPLSSLVEICSAQPASRSLKV